MKEEWARRQEQWRTFNDWEQARLRYRGEPVDPMKWMGEAWELARKADPTWGSSTNREEHVRHLVRIREMLAKAFPERWTSSKKHWRSSRQVSTWPMCLTW